MNRYIGDNYDARDYAGYKKESRFKPYEEDRSRLYDERYKGQTGSSYGIDTKVIPQLNREVKEELVFGSVEADKIYERQGFNSERVPYVELLAKNRDINKNNVDLDEGNNMVKQISEYNRGISNNKQSFYGMNHEKDHIEGTKEVVEIKGVGPTSQIETSASHYRSKSGEIKKKSVSTKKEVRRKVNRAKSKSMGRKQEYVLPKFDKHCWKCFGKEMVLELSRRGILK